MADVIIQVAGIQTIEEAFMLASEGATHLGFPFGLDFHREDTTLATAAAIIKQLPGHVFPVLITYHHHPKTVYGLMQKLGCSIVQLHGKVEPAEIDLLRKLFPKVEIWKSLVIHPGKAEVAIKNMQYFEPLVDAFITDTFDPETGASGATGKTHDWNVSREIVKQSKNPVIIAGGLNPENIFKAVVATRPAGVDVHTGVENNDGTKSRKLVRSFVENAKKAFHDIDQVK